jgi:hypothetical protein
MTNIDRFIEDGDNVDSMNFSNELVIIYSDICNNMSNSRRDEVYSSIIDLENVMQKYLPVGDMDFF